MYRAEHDLMGCAILFSSFLVRKKVDAVVLTRVRIRSVLGSHPSSGQCTILSLHRSVFTVAASKEACLTDTVRLTHSLFR